MSILHTSSLLPQTNSMVGREAASALAALAALDTVDNEGGGDGGGREAEDSKNGARRTSEGGMDSRRHRQVGGDMWMVEASHLAPALAL